MFVINYVSRLITQDSTVVRGRSIVDVHTSIESRDDGTRILSVAGELDLYTSPRFQEQLPAALEQPFEWLLIDLSDCDYLDSTAIHVLVQAKRSLDGCADRLALIVPSPQLRM